MTQTIRPWCCLPAVVSGALASVPCAAQCLDAAPGFEAPGVVRGLFQGHPIGEVRSYVVFDDGSGPALYVGGRFTQAGAVAAANVARWDGAHWSALGDGLLLEGSPFNLGVVRALAVFDDDTGPALYAAGQFSIAGGQSGIAKWNGATWSTVGTGGLDYEARALAVFDDGSGPALYMTGSFQTVGGVSATGIAKWDGSAWSAVAGESVSQGEALAVFDDGTGAALYVACSYVPAGGGNAGGVLRFDGSTWSVVGGSFNSVAYALAVYDAGSGAELHAAGAFTLAAGTPCAHVARWDGTAWHPLGVGLDDVAYALRVHGVGANRALYAGGIFSTAGGVPARNVAKWKSGVWSALALGLETTGGLNPISFTEGVRALASFDGGSGHELYAGGRFDVSGTAAMNNIARFDGAQWLPLGQGDGLGRPIERMISIDEGSGPVLYAAGSFHTAGSIVAPGFARFDGGDWSTIDVDVQGLYFSALGTFDFGSGPVLLAGGVEQWDGVAWTQVGAQFTNEVHAFVTYDDGTGAKLYVGGAFSNFGLHVSRWNGSAWMNVDSGVNGTVTEMVVYDDGTRPALVVGGEFTHAGSLPAQSVARWDGAQWSALGFGPTGLPVVALAVFDGGDGAKLYGAARVDGGGARVARWNGTSWTSVGETFVSEEVLDLAVFGDGTPDGVALYAAGRFTSLGGVPAQNLARFDGSAWHAVGGGTSGRVNTLCVWNDGSDATADLWLGGDFVRADGVGSSFLAKWRGCTGPGTPYCFGDGSLATPCPCAPPNVVPVPSGAPFAGCASVKNPHGASLAAAGATNPDTIALVASGITPNGFGMFFKGDAQIAGGLAIADGVRCVGGSFVRFGLQSAVSGVSRYPNAVLGFTTPVSVVGGTPPGSGSNGDYQFVYRSAQPGFRGPGTLNFTNAYRLTW